MYSVDTNIYLDWWERRYPDDVFPTIKSRVEALVTSGAWRAVEGVKTEIGHVGGPALKSWARTTPVQFHLHDATLLTQANAISTQFPGLIDPNARHDEADRYVIALAKLKGLIVITHETPAHTKRNPPRTHYIPDVCAALSIPCIGLLEFMRREGWTFN